MLRLWNRGLLRRKTATARSHKGEEYLVDCGLDRSSCWQKRAGPHLDLGGGGPGGGESCRDRGGARLGGCPSPAPGAAGGSHRAQARRRGRARRQ